MLLTLTVKNFALIEEVCLEFGRGFSVISGETGAGKSILVGALGLLLGGRADLESIRSGTDEAVIEAMFDIEHNPSVINLLNDLGLSDGDDLIVRRHLLSQGKSKIFVNGRAVTLAQLELITKHLIDLSGQHDQQGLLNEENHRSLLDSDDSITPLLKKYEIVFAEYQKIKTDYQKLKSAGEANSQRIDYLKFQIAEIDKAVFKDDDEEEKLLEEKGRVKNADALFSLCRDVADADETITLLNRWVQTTNKLADVDASLKGGAGLLEQSRLHLDEAIHFFSDYREKLACEPGRLDAIESRLYQIYQLKKKFGETIQAIRQKGSDLKTELNQLEHRDDFLAELENQLTLIAKKLARHASELSVARKKRAADLEKKIQKELKTLSMPEAVFKISVQSPENPQADHCSEYGFDQVRFEMAPNIGEGLKPISKIASGGELSRILLAIKQVVKTSVEPITYIFDEVDTGIGGAVAQVVGEKLRALGEKNQVFCVTHLPQVASQGDQHYVISKSVTKGRTSTHIQTVADDNRIQEIARMLSGDVSSKVALAHAREMLDRS